MEILKEGNAKRIKKCWRCKTKFIYDLSKDIWHFWNDFVKCPVCKENNNISIFDRKYKGKSKEEI